MCKSHVACLQSVFSYGRLAVPRSRHGFKGTPLLFSAPRVSGLVKERRGVKAGGMGMLEVWQKTYRKKGQWRIMSLCVFCMTTITAFTVSALDFTQIATVAARTGAESAASRSRQNSAGTATSSEQTKEKYNGV